jgi:arabinose-5-phosphate isomerase
MAMDYLEKAKRVLDIEIFELKRLRERLSDDFSRAVQLVKDAVDNRGKVVVVGVGKSGHIGAKIASTLTSTGSPAVVLDSLNALHGDLGMVADGDVILALSASGETEELLRILPAIARFQVKINPGPELSCSSRCSYRTGSLSVESGADLEHNGDARPRRCPGHGSARSARV